MTNRRTVSPDRTPTERWKALRRAGLLLGVCLAGSSLRLEALNPDLPTADYVVRMWSSEQGLPHDIVYGVQQTRDGYVWMATQNGLVRFDGLRFTVFDSLNTKAFTENGIRALAASPDGSLWFMPVFSDPISFKGARFTRLEGFMPSEWRQASVVRALVDSRGRLWLAGGDGVAYRTPGGVVQTIVKPHVAAPGTLEGQSLAEDAQGRIWCTTTRGVLCIEDGSVVRTLPLSGAEALDIDRQGVLWVSAGWRRIVRFTPTGRADVSLPNGRAMDIHCDRSGNVWVATNVGLLRFDASGRRGSPVERLNGLHVQSLFEDRDGRLWVATRTGMGYVRDPTFRAYTQAGPQRVLSLVEGRTGTILLATDTPPFLQQVRPGGMLETLAPPEAVLALHRDREGVLWLGGARGLYRFDGRSWLRLHDTPPGPIAHIVSDARGQLWVADAHGALYRIDPKGYVTFGAAQGIPVGRWIEQLYAGRDGALWIATREGLFRFQHGQASQITLGAGAPVNYVRSVHQDDDGALWFGTRAGLVRSKAGQYRLFTAHDGLPDPIVHGIVDDGQGRLWVGCTRGVYRVDKKDFDDLVAQRISAVRSLLFDRGDGIVAGQAWGHCALRARDGSLWFGTTRGAVAISQTLLDVEVTPPTVVLESIGVDGRVYPLDQAVDAPPGEGRLELRFTAPSFHAPHRLRFRYRLEGIDSDWHLTEGQREATYTRIPPGRYTFQLAAANSGGLWSETASSPVIALRPHFHETRTFYGLVTLVTLGAIWGGIRYRVRWHVARERVLKRHVDEALERIKVLKGLLPICAWCHKVRDDKGYYTELETYIREHSEADFSHGICPDCFAKRAAEFERDADRYREALRKARSG